MKQIYSLALLAMCLSVNMKISAQGIYQYWGTNTQGGSDHQGTAFTLRMDGGGSKVRSLFSYTDPGAHEFASRGIIYNNKMYMTAGGGIKENGTLLAYDLVNGTHEKLVDFYSYNEGYTPETNLVLYNNKLYGVCKVSADNDGYIFEYDPVTKIMIRKFNFSSSTLALPTGGLLLWGDELWGCTISGGANSDGGIYSYDLGSNSFTVRHDLNEPAGSFPHTILSLYNNKLYGLCSAGGINDAGTLFEYNPATDIYTTRHFFGVGSGITPSGELTLYNNKFYGQTSYGGSNSKGTIFEFDPSNNAFTTKLNNTDLGGSGCQDGFTVYNSRLYALNPSGGTGGEGTIIDYDPATNIVTKRLDCTLAKGMDASFQMCVYNNKMYGIAFGGPFDDDISLNDGLIFEFNPANNAMIAKVNFGSTNGKRVEGPVSYLNGKVYGLTSRGGEYGYGTIWEYDLATYTYTVRYNFDGYSPRFHRSMLFIGSKLYGTAVVGTPGSAGAFWSFDVNSGVFTMIKVFGTLVEGSNPRGELLLYDNKIWGTSSFGGNGTSQGTIWQYDLATLIFSVKVNIGPSVGEIPFGGLTVYNGRFYGMCVEGGVNSVGTIFEYRPDINGIVKKFDFGAPGFGGYPETGFTLIGDKLYGANGSGKVFTFEPANGNVTVIGTLLAAGASTPRARLTYNPELEKLFGSGQLGGATNFGSYFEYDLINNVSDNILTCNPPIGTGPVGELKKLPAFVAPGNPGNCAPGGSATVDASNENEWITFTNSNGDAVAEINPNGNQLGRVNVTFYVHDGATRQKNGFYYLDRNITITTDNPPVTPVSVRLYTRKTEFESLKNTPGSGIVSIGNLSVFKNDDACSNTMTGPAVQLPTFVTTWGGDHVFITSVTSFSTFYFASSLAVLPLNILSFNGTKEAATNKLSWKASCDNAVDFVIERSSNGINFTPIGTVHAQAQDCNSVFYFTDLNPATKAYYRLKMTEINGPVKYSNIILLNRDSKENFTISIFPNPVVGDQANLQINADKKRAVPLTISDATGRIVLRRTVTVQDGTNSYQLPVSQLGAGIYQLTYNDGEKNGTIRFVKQ